MENTAENSTSDVTNLANLITITNGEAIALLGNPLWVSRGMPVKTRYWLSRIADKLQGIAKLVSTEREKIIHENCVRDADGKPVLKEGKKYTFDPPEKEIDANNAIKELMAIENKLPWPKQIIDLSKVTDAFELSAADMADAAAVAEFVFEEAPPAPPAK